MKKVIAFDLDGTLAPSKSPMPDRMAELLRQLLTVKQVCVMSGGRFEQFEKQLLSSLKAAPEELARLHLMPTCGTRYFKFEQGKWQKVYAEDFTEAEKQKIVAAFKKGVKSLGYEEEKVYGETIEDRESQITFSTYGQNIVDVLGEEGLKIKEAWDPDDSKKGKLRDYLMPLLPEFEVRVGGITSVDVTKQGIDKAYGISKLMDILKLEKEDILFIGDRIREGGNDYPVKTMGVDCLEISHWQETALVVDAIIKTS